MDLSNPPGSITITNEFYFVPGGKIQKIAGTCPAIPDRSIAGKTLALIVPVALRVPRALSNPLSCPPKGPGTDQVIYVATVPHSVL